ncbi:hypothetical protein GUJ93_ZPchr0006g43789 [Zizania palustris]|uniref:IQ calmodulin-binding motif family protein n=1 Tax=Zizania palustris TaxID=103762 RepID=A0A8J5VN89_ZIZPA|nr:hypothetical protein GUJ93_ZPchr0006g43789 [Zizania palustris]
MPRARGLSCLMSPLHGKRPSGDARRSSVACICCIGPHHKPSYGSSGADLGVRAPLTGCCGSGGDDRGHSSSSAHTPRTPNTLCMPTARRLCGVRSSTPSRGQVGCFQTSAPTAVAVRTHHTPTTPIGRSQLTACCVRGPAQGNAKLGKRGRWLRSTGQAMWQTTPRRTARAGGGVGSNSDVKVYNTGIVEAEAEAAAKEEETCSNDEYALLCREGFPREDVAAVTIQAYFRGHLARRAFKALKSLVRLQAVARGASVRRQAEVAIHCMQAMVRLQVRVRARQMLTKPKEGLLLQS